MISDEDYVIVECVLRSDVLRHRMRGLLREEVEDKVGSLVDGFRQQVCRDALIGTYRDYTAAVFGSAGAASYQSLKAATEAAARIQPEFNAADLEGGVLPFRLELQSKWFRDVRMGFQQLIHVLCGDIFSRAAANIRGSVEVRRLTLGHLGSAFAAHYRPKSHTIDEIRKLFSLNSAPLLFGHTGEKADLPLLAFSLKPRNGLSHADFKRVAEGVLRAGFNLVEADVRNIDFMQEDWRKTYAQIATTAIGITSHVARFSLNLSGPADLAVAYAREFKALHPADGPWVLKVDGGLDGISTIQALRSHFGSGASQPILTCYPVLSDTLAPRIGAETFRETLVLSGVDIIYPGGAPRIGDGDFIDYEGVERGWRRYSSLSREGWPMLSIAGGIHAGQLPAYYELLGPKVAYFLGGGVALHRNGAFYDPPAGMFKFRAKAAVLGEPITPKQAVGGAELCRFAVEAAATERDTNKLRDVLAQTQQHYMELVEGTDPGKKYQFVNPRLVLVGSLRSFREGR